ncbi:MAG: hypothetical protein V1724_03050 [Chloroflexota bacterium]
MRQTAVRLLLSLRSEGGAALVLLFAAIAFNLYTLLPELTIPTPNLNDGVLHLTLIQSASQALSHGENLTDFWVPYFNLGYPVFHYYQHLPHIAIALLHIFTFKLFSLVFLFNLSQYLLLSLYPLAIYWAMRRFGFGRLPSGLAGLASSLLSTDGLYGLEYGSYVWRGFGLYTQLWAMLLLPLCLAQLYVTTREGKGYFLSILLLAATLLSHVIYGYIAILSAVLFLFLQPHPREVLQQGKRLAIVLTALVLVVSYFTVPLLLDRDFLNRSVWELTSKYDSLGHVFVLKTLLSGNLLDFGRLPSLSLLLLVGLAVAVFRYKDEKHRAIIVLFVAGLLLYFGRPTWGVLLNLLPMSRDLPLHRLIGGVHLGATFLIGVGFAALWEFAQGKPRLWRFAVLPLVALLLLAPIYKERFDYLAANSRWMEENSRWFAKEQKDLDSLLAALQSLPPGRVYSGLGGNWGKDYRVGYVPMYALYPGAGIDSLGYLYHALSLNADIQVNFDETRSDQYELFNVRYVVLPTDRTPPAFLTRMDQFGRHVLYQAPASGYFELVDSDIALVGDKADWYKANLQWLQSPLPASKQHPSIFFSLGKVQATYPATLLMGQVDANTLAASVPVAQRPPAGAVQLEGSQGDTYLALANVERQSYLMLKVTFHPNWQAWVDGMPVKTVMLSPSYVGIRLDKGVHQVVLQYKPGPMRSYLLLLGLLTLPLVALAEWRRERLARLMERWNPERLTAFLRRGSP